MIRHFCLFIFGLIWSCHSWAALLHFYNNPHVPQAALYHVTLEYQGNMFEANPQYGGHKQALSKIKKLGDIRIEISDSLINEPALEAEMGKSFDFNFEWDNNKTYCAKLVGKALNMKPTPMNFAGTHYAIFKPDWLKRHDPGLSPDQIYKFAVEHAINHRIAVF